MEPVSYTFTVTYKDVSKKKCAFVGEHIPYDKRYERWLDEVGVSEMAMWIVDQVFNSEKKRLNENVTIPSSLTPVKGSKRNKQHIMNCMFRAVRKALTDYVLFKYENHVKAGWDPDDIKTAGFTLTVDVPGTGKAKDYKVDIVSQTGSTMRAIQALLNSTHDVFVDHRQYMQEQSRYTVAQTHLTAVRPNMPQLTVAFTNNNDPEKSLNCAVLDFATFSSKKKWEHINATMYRVPRGWVPDEKSDMNAIVKQTHLDLESLSYILSAIYDEKLAVGDLPVGGCANVAPFSTDTQRGSNAIEIGDRIYIGDPCYTIDDPGCVGYICNALPGWWNFYAPLDKNIKRPKQLEVRHSSTLGKKIDYKPFGFVGVDSGQMGVYDGSLRELLGTDREFYPVVCRGTLEKDVFNYRGRGVVCATLYGDGQYNTYIAEQDGKVVAVKIDFK